ncbi:MBL fold metallo-hydrolase [Streptomyces cucumeris]|uniref:MBL fold metallo-hydrolase n=1 Tax=Streptomyces cucumeris TaxID=2962890 RepID=UPI003D720065
MGSLSWVFGDVRVAQVTESVVGVPVDVFFPVATAQELEKHREWLHPDFIDDDGMLRIAVQSLLIEADGRKIVVDTCIGNEPPEAHAQSAVSGTQYLDDLTAAGFERHTVDFVLCTHLHVDHVGWNTMRAGDHFEPTFPQARYLFSAPALSAWKEQLPTETPSHGTITSMQPLLDAEVVDAVPLDHRITDSVRLESTPGHTRGHVAVHIESQGQHALITGDLTHHPVQWAEPHWTHFSDVDGSASIATRRRIMDTYADTDVTIIGTHYAAPTVGRLTKKDGGRFIPLGG